MRSLLLVPTFPSYILIRFAWKDRFFLDCNTGDTFRIQSMRWQNWVHLYLCSTAVWQSSCRIFSLCCYLLFATIVFAYHIFQS